MRSNMNERVCALLHDFLQEKHEHILECIDNIESHI